MNVRYYLKQFTIKLTFTHDVKVLRKSEGVLYFSALMALTEPA